MAETKNATDSNRTVVSQSEDDVIILEDSGLGDFVMPAKQTGAENENEEERIDLPENNTTTGGKRDDDTDGLKLFAKALHENGVLPNLNQEEFDGSLESLIGSVGDEITNGISEYKKSLPKEVQYAIENYEEGVPLHTLFAAKAKTFEFNNMDESKLSDDVAIQKRIVTEFLKLKGFNDVKIDKMVGKYDELGDLEEEAKDSLKELKLHYKNEEDKVKKDASAKKIQDEKNSRDLLSGIKTSIDKKDEIIPGIKINKSVKDNLYSSMTEISGYGDGGRPYNKVMELRSKDPVSFDITLHYLMSLGVFDGKWDTLKNAIKVDTGKQIDNVLKNRSGLMNGKSATVSETVKAEDILKGLRSRIPSFQS